MIKSSPHVHTDLVDGISPARQTVEKALDKGFCSLGFSEHARQPFNMEAGLSQSDEKLYIKIVKELSQTYSDELTISLGIERDEYSICNRSEYSYIIGSKHYIAREDYSDFFAVDSDEKTVKAGCDRFFGGNWYALCDRYFRELADYICSFKPDIIAHFDLVTKLNEKAGFFDENDPRYMKAGYGALERMSKAVRLMEINTGAMSRGYRTSPYPAPPFLKRWRELGGEIVFSSDCHNAKYLDYGYDAALKLALDTGYDAAWRICSRDGKFERYAIR